MKRQSILFILLLLLTLLTLCACGSSDQPVTSRQAAQPAETSLEDAENETAAPPTEEDYENVSGIFEGLEDNHTALFSFDGAETTFYFEEYPVHLVLYNAVLGSSYTFSYHFNSDIGLYEIYEISE